MRISGSVALACTLLGAAGTRHLLDNHVARTPPMGWNSWNHFGCDVSAQLIRETADAMVASGLRDAGYQYVVIDDCWQVARDARGRLATNVLSIPTYLSKRYLSTERQKDPAGQNQVQQ